MMGVLRQCRKRNIIALPVYDCVVVKRSEAETVEKTMKKQFKAVTGLSILVKSELPE
jgi:hypothetical protein